jgi:hypothetical protein
MNPARTLWDGSYRCEKPSVASVRILRRPFRVLLLHPTREQRAGVALKRLSVFVPAAAVFAAPVRGAEPVRPQLHGDAAPLRHPPSARSR